MCLFKGEVVFPSFWADARTKRKEWASQQAMVLYPTATLKGRKPFSKSLYFIFGYNVRA